MSMSTDVRVSTIFRSIPIAPLMTCQAKTGLPRQFIPRSQKSPFSSRRRKRSQFCFVYTGVMISSSSFHSKTLESVENDCEPRLRVCRLSDLDWNRCRLPVFTSSFSKVSKRFHLSLSGQKRSIFKTTRFQKSALLKPFSKFYLFIRVFRSF